MGAPEALVIGVVALLVFGPKGLANIAEQLGQTLRAFQPTIKELQEVSREFRDTLEDEIGLDEIRNDIAGVTAPVPTKRRAPAPDPVDTDTAVSAPSAPSADESENMVTEEMRAQAAAAAWGGDEPEQAAAPVEPPSRSHRDSERAVRAGARGAGRAGAFARRGGEGVSLRYAFVGLGPVYLFN